MMTREEHLAFCKQRARVYLERNDLLGAVTSMLSDLEKHPEQGKTNPHLSYYGMMSAAEGDTEAVWRFIEGFR